jgi:rhamnosyltransferase
MNASRSPSVSIALITQNGMATLPAVLDAIAGQQSGDRPEVVAVDSASKDGTAELLEDRIDRLINIRAEDFDHGLTRNLAVEECRGELVVLLVQDAVPASSGWLAGLVAPFADDPRVAGTFARQLPHPDSSRLSRWNLSRWVASRPEPRVSGLADPSDWTTLDPMERLEAAAFDNVCSCVRRSVWQDIPFRATSIAEDLEWGREVLLAGHRIASAPSAAVLHCHERPVRYELDRTVLVHRRLHELFGVRTIPSLAHLVHAVAVTVVEHARVLGTGEGPRPGVREVARALGLAVAWPLGQYLGGRAAVTGTGSRHPRGT